MFQYGYDNISTPVGEHSLMSLLLVSELCKYDILARPIVPDPTSVALTVLRVSIGNVHAWVYSTALLAMSLLITYNFDIRIKWVLIAISLAANIT